MGVIERVEGADDPRIAAYASVGDHAWLRARGLFVAEGRLVLRRLLESRFAIESVLLTPAALQSLSPLEAPAPVFVADPEIVNAVTGFNFHRGCLALGRRPAATERLARPTTARLLLALEGIGNPDNVGGLFRVAAAFGAGGVLLDAATGDPFYRKAVRTSMGAVLTVPFERLADWPSALDPFRRLGATLVALTPDASAVPLVEFVSLRPADARRRALVVMVGAEGAGLSDEALREADVKVRIPIAPEVDSLNVVVAAGIALAFLTTRPES